VEGRGRSSSIERGRRSSSVEGRLKRNPSYAALTDSARRRMSKPPTPRSLTHSTSTPTLSRANSSDKLSKGKKPINVLEQDSEEGEEFRWSRKPILKVARTQNEETEEVAPKKAKPHVLKGVPTDTSEEEQTDEFMKEMMKKAWNNKIEEEWNTKSSLKGKGKKEKGKDVTKDTISETMEGMDVDEELNAKLLNLQNMFQNRKKGIR
jgi:hypothetical protein